MSGAAAKAGEVGRGRIGPVMYCSASCSRHVGMPAPLSTKFRLTTWLGNGKMMAWINLMSSELNENLEDMRAISTKLRSENEGFVKRIKDMTSTILPLSLGDSWE